MMQTQTDREEPAQGSGTAAAEELGPVFIPIVLAMEPGEHRVLLEDWCRQQAVTAGSPCHPVAMRSGHVCEQQSSWTNARP
jgi:hypothetical protein